MGRNLDEDGGEAGIRTLGTPKGATDFESAPFDRSGTSPNAGDITRWPGTAQPGLSGGQARGGRRNSTG
jgi:hypothetical protein